MSADNDSGMTIKQRLYMPPIEKYERFDRFPWKILIQALLVIFTTTETLLVVNRVTSYSYSQYLLWNKLFLNLDVDGSDTAITNSYNLFSINDVISFVQGTSSKYYHINKHTVDNYSHEHKDNGDIEPIKLYVDYLHYDEVKDLGYEFEYDITEDDLGPFSHLNPKKYLDKVKRFEMKFTLNHHLNHHMDLSSNCYKWTISQHFDYSMHGVVNTVLSTDRGTCSGHIISPNSQHMWIGVIVVLLAACSLMTVWKYFLKRAKILATIRGGPQDFRHAWESLALTEKLKFFNLWIVFTIIGNLCQIFGGILTVIDQDVSLNAHEHLVGIGCFCAWVGSVRFLEHKSTSYTIINTLSRSFSTIGPYIVGIIPIFLAFVFLAMCLFWKTGIYPTTSTGMIAAFALVNGDSVYQFTSQLVLENSFLGQLYVYCFIVFFICCVQNIFIAIIQEGFRSLSENPPKRGDESDEESDEEELGSIATIRKGKKNVKKLMEEENRKKAQEAFKMILSVKKNQQISEETQSQLLLMDNVAKNIVDSMWKLIAIAEPLPSQKANRDALKFYLATTCQLKIKDALDKIKRNLEPEDEG